MLKQLIKNAGKQHEVRWEDIRKAACAPCVHRATLKRSFGRLGQKVQACSPHAKPNRTPGQAIHRVAYCRQWPREPPAFSLSAVGLITGNQQLDIPTTDRARRHLASQRVRFHLRTPGEGVLLEMTKPGRKKNRMSMGSVAKACAEAAATPVWWPPPRGLLGAARGRLGDVLGYALGYVPRGRCENWAFLNSHMKESFD